MDLRRQILQAAARDPLQFNGLHHLFILAFGRLSYADPPDFLKSELKDTTTKMGGEFMDQWNCPAWIKILTRLTSGSFPSS